jgi:predicted kinase
MPKIIICKGLPASGKSTWAREQCKNDYKRINKDDLRKMCHDNIYNGKKEKFILAMRNIFIYESLMMGYNIIIDDTNLNPAHEESIRQLVKSYCDDQNCSVSIEVKFFDTPLEECIIRDDKRPIGEKVGEKVIRDMYNKYLKKSVEYIKDTNLKNCIIVDIDGTLAIRADRNQYDESKVYLDNLNTNISDIVNSYKKNNPDIYVMIFSGRKDSCKEMTIKWLNKYQIMFDEIHMRSVDDNRKDSIVKKELFETYIRNKYNCLFVLDDRNSVVNMWRNDLGLQCLQVAEGDF